MITKLTKEQIDRFPEFVKLNEQISFNPQDGFFRWKIKGRNRRLNGIVGSKDNRGYVKIRYKNKQFWAHRLAWAFTYGIFPQKDIDHINGKKSDNRICNLREVSRSINLHNTKPRNLSGIKGVYWQKKAKAWQVRITVNYKNYYLGIFKKLDEAKNARDKAFYFLGVN